MNKRNELLVFVKNPVKGRVKTRLAKDLGPEEALRIYRHLLEYTHEVVAQSGLPYSVHYSDEVIQGDLWNEAAYKQPQVGPDLGTRLARAFDRAFRAGNSKVCVIGSDSAEIRPEDIRAAFAALDETEVVIGPAQDGGYWLIGMARYFPELFEHKSWSTASLLDETIGTLKDLDTTYTLLKELNDIDTLEDLSNSDASFLRKLQQHI